MIDRHLRTPDLPDFDAPTICQGITARIADIRRDTVSPISGDERATRPADKGFWAEVR